MTRDFDVESEDMPELDLERIVSEELFAAATRGQQAWQENLRRGVGATGSHGRAYVDTGEAVNDITISPPTPGALEYVVGGDVVQLAVAEFGRRPGRPPPHEAIAAWAKRVGLTPDEGESFDDMVTAIRFAIAERGLPAFAPGQKAFDETTQDLEERIRARIAREDARHRPR